MRLLNWETGQVVEGRCGATNKCLYCAKLFAVETSEMLALDAIEDAPTLYMVLTAREHLTRTDCYSHLQQVRRSLRKRWPDVRWALTVEFQRRGALHLNLLIKGVPIEDLDELHEAVVAIWCTRVDALPRGQWSDVIADELGVVRYIGLHFLKSVQAPAIGWRGHRYSSTRDYLVRPASIMREEARQSLRGKRELWRVKTLYPELSADAIEDAVQTRLEQASQATWELRFVPTHLLRRADGRATRARADVNPAQRAS